MCRVAFNFLLLFSLTLAATKLSAADSFFVVGNSLTWDAKPYDLEGDVDFHIFCSRHLRYIHQNPDGHCIPQSTPWNKALNEKEYDWLVVQPFSGTTLEEDVFIISEWMALQPDAVLVIHTGWSPFRNFPGDYQA